jgi:hypothetical protein
MDDKTKGTETRVSGAQLEQLAREWLRTRIYWACAIKDAIDATYVIIKAMEVLDVRRTLLESDVRQALAALEGEDIEQMRRMHARLVAWREVGP